MKMCLGKELDPATKQKQRGGFIASQRFKVLREAGADWQVIDTRSKNIPVATGLDLEEAQRTADTRNKKRRWRKKQA